MVVPPRLRRWIDRTAAVGFALVILICVAIIIQRDAVRAYWWAGALQRATTGDERVACVTRLAALGGAAVPAARRLLADERPMIRSLAVNALVHAGTPSGRDALISALADADAEVRDDAAHALAFGYGEGAVSALTARLPEMRGMQALAACVALGRAEEGSATAALVSMAVTHAQSDVRAQAIEMLGIRRADNAVAILQPLAADSTTITAELYGARRSRQAFNYAQSSGAGEPATAESGGRTTVGDVARAALAMIQSAPATATGSAPVDNGDPAVPPGEPR